MSIKLLVVDLDKTLLRSDQSISEHTAQAFEKVKQAGILPVIATGRSTPESAYAIERTGADRYIIGMTGAFLYDLHSDSSLFERHIDFRLVESIIGILDEFDGVFYQLYADNRVYTTPRSFEWVHDCGLSEEYIEFSLKTLNVIPDCTGFYGPDTRVEKFFVNTRDTQTLAAIKEKCSKLPGLTLFTSLETALEVLPENVDKGRAVQALCEHLNIQRHEVAAIGDSENDLALFEAAGLKIAVQNAFDCLKEHAEYIVPSNDEDGVAYAIHEIVLKQLA